jgi:hypothetical protein
MPKEREKGGAPCVKERGTEFEPLANGSEKGGAPCTNMDVHSSGTNSYCIKTDSLQSSGS